MSINRTKVELTLTLTVLLLLWTKEQTYPDFYSGTLFYYISFIACGMEYLQYVVLLYIYVPSVLKLQYELSVMLRKSM